MAAGDFLLGQGIISQLVLAVVIAFVLHIGLLSLDTLVRVYKRMGSSRIELMPYTYSSEAKSYQVRQNPNLKDAVPIFMSDNELTGIEFSYSFYMNVSKNNFSGSSGLMHVFHKGNSSLFPLLGPGVFMKSETNTMRVYMNSYKTWNNYCDIENIPIGKWFHCTLVYKNNGLEVFINGNMIKKLSFTDTVPYQNYGDYYFFSMNKFLPNRACVDAEEGMQMVGAFKGMLSRVRYYNYALSYSEINSLMNEGPSDKVDPVAMGGVPPYLVDNWWV